MVTEVVVVGMVIVVGDWSGDDRIEAEMYGAERRKSLVLRSESWVRGKRATVSTSGYKKIKGIGG